MAWIPMIQEDKAEAELKEWYDNCLLYTSDAADE